MDSTTRTSTTTADAEDVGRAATASATTGRRAAVRKVLRIALVACVVANGAVSWLDAPVAVHVVLRVVTAVAGAVLVMALIRRGRWGRGSAVRR